MMADVPIIVASAFSNWMIVSCSSAVEAGDLFRLHEQTTVGDGPRTEVQRS